MADRRSSTIPKPSEEEKKIKKKAEAMLAKSENNWNKITPDQKEVLNSPTSAHFFQIPQSEYKLLEKDWKEVGIPFSENPDRIEFCTGKLFVNAADPSNLSWAKSTKLDKSINEINKVNLLTLSQMFSATRESLSKDNKVLLSKIGEKLEDYDQEYAIWKKEENKICPIDFFISEGKEAAQILNIVGITDEKVKEDNLVLISTKESLLFIVFKKDGIADQWLISLKILLKAQNLSYRGTKDEYSPKKKDLIKDIVKDKDLRLESKNNNILLWIVDLELDSYLYRELKIYLWNRSKEHYLFFVIDMRKPLKETKQIFNEKFKSYSFLCRELMKIYLNEVKISRFFLILQEDYDVSLESKGMNFNKDNLMDTSHSEFWKTRKKIRRNYRALVLKQDWQLKKDLEKKFREELKAKGRKKKKKHRILESKPKIEDRFDVNCLEVQKIYSKIRKTVFEEKNQILKALKVLQMQKQMIRSRLIRISVFRNENNRYRKSRGGKAFKNRALKTTEKKAKKAYTAASNVLKIMMFEDTIPGLIPEQIRSSLKQEEKKRDGCCEVI